MTIRVALLDDQSLVRSGIRSLLSLSDKVVVVAEGADGSEAVEIARTKKPDVFLMDIRMPRVSGIDAIRALRAAGIGTPTIILTTFDDHRTVLDGVSALRVSIGARTTEREHVAALWAELQRVAAALLPDD